MSAVVLGIDGGGTRTRASIVNGEKVLAFAETSRPFSPSFDHPFDDRRMFRGGFGLVG